MVQASDDIDLTLTTAPSGVVRTSVSLMFGLTLVTLGLYYPIWFLRQRIGINHFNPSIPIRRWPFVLLGVTHAAWVLLAISGTRVPIVGGLRVAWVLPTAVAVLWAFTVVQCLAIRRAIERHAGIVLSAATTVYQGAFYLQYVINTALFIELSSETIEVIERTERLQFEQSLTDATPYVFVTPALVALNCVMFVVVAIGTRSLSAPSGEAALRFGADFGPLATHGQWWRLLTSTFVHFGFLHLFFNMFVFWRIGRTIERAYGNLGFAVLYGLAGVGGALASLYWQPQAVSAGASGAIFGLFGGLLAFVLSEHQTIPERIASSMTKSAGAFLVYTLLDGLSANFAGGIGRIGTMRVDVAAHLGGLATGFVAGRALALPLDHSRRSARWLRSVVTAAVGVVAAAAVARTLPVVDDFGATANRIDAERRQLVERYASALTKLSEKKIRPEQFADVLEKEVLPPWTDLRSRLNGLRVDRAQDVLVRRTVDFMTLESDGITYNAEGIRKSDNALIERGREDFDAATRIVNGMRGRLGAIEYVSTLSGVLKSSGDRSVAGAEVSLVCNSYTGAASRSAAYVAGCKTARTTETDARGRFAFSMMPPGLYTLSTKAAAYRDAQRDVEVDGATRTVVTLVPLVDQFRVAVEKLTAAEKRALASYNGALKKLEARSITRDEFSRIVESDVVAVLTRARDSMVLDDLPAPRQAAAVTIRQYASLRSEAFDEIARGVATNNVELMKHGESKQAEAMRLMKGLTMPH